MAWILVVCGVFQTLANVPDISLNYISKAACRVSAGPNRGSGVAVSLDAKYVYVLTNAHVVESYQTVSVEFYRYGAKTNPLQSTVYSKILTQDKDFAILSVPRNSFGNTLPEIIPLVPPTYQLKPNTYFATAGHPFSRDMTAREGLIKGEEGSRIIFTPPPDQGQSGSGMFVRIGDKVYVVGIITFKSGDYTMDLNGNPKTWGAGFHVNRLRDKLSTTSEYDDILYPVVETLYALGSDGKYYPQDSEGGATVPMGVQITQWNCPSGTCRPLPQQAQPPMVPLPRREPLPIPVVPQPKLQNPATTAPPANNNSGPFQNLPDGFGDPVPNEGSDLPIPEVQPPVIEPETDTEVSKKIKELTAELDLLKLKLIEKESRITTLELTLKEQAENPDLNNCKKEVLELKATIEAKNTEIAKLQLDIQALKEFLPPTTEPDVTPPVEPPVIEQPVTPTEPTEITAVVDKTSTWDSVKTAGKKLTPLWLVLAGVGGTLLLGKYKAIAAVPGLIGGLFAKKKVADTAAVVSKVAQYAPELKELMTWMNQKFNANDEKLNGVTDYVTSKLDDISNKNVVNNNINIDSGSDDDGLDFKKVYQGKPVSDRVKQFFDLKKKDGDSIEKWAFFALLYKEAMQLLRKGYFEIDIVGSKVPLQGQKLAADKIDGWVRDEFLKRTTVDKLDYNHLYHEAMIGFLYKEAVRLLRIGQFPVLGAKETAIVIENWVKKEFLERMGITL